MSLRSCCYKDCENYSINNVPSGPFTLFQFPKDVNRRRKWMILGQVNPDIPPKELYMCSDHFDPTKHMSINQRRTLLLGAAEPFPYVEKPNEENITVASESMQQEEAAVDTVRCTVQEDNMSYMFFEADEVEIRTNSRTHKQVDEEQFPVESTIEEDDEGNILTYGGIKIRGNADEDNENESNDYVDSEMVSDIEYKINDKPATTSNKKRKMVETFSDSKQKSNNSIRVKTFINAEEALKLQTKPNHVAIPDGNNSLQEDIDEITLIDPQHVSTFIFKGEEYVQMPKEYFLKDKLALLRKVERYESVLRSLKHKLNLMDLS